MYLKSTIIFSTLILLFVVCINAYSSDTTNCPSHFDSSSNRQVYNFVDQMPTFPGGIDEMKKFIALHLRYPESICLQGSVFVSFIVEPDGNIAFVKIVKSLGKQGDQEVLKMMEKMPNWIPGLCNGEIVPVEIVIPVSFNFNYYDLNKK